MRNTLVKLYNLINTNKFSKSTTSFKKYWY